MKNKQYKPIITEATKAEEPVAEYGNRIIFHNSLAEMNESQYVHWRSLSTLQRLAEHFKLLNITYSNEELNQHSNRIIYKK